MHIPAAASRISIAIFSMMLSLLILSQSCKAPTEGDIPRQKQLLNNEKPQNELLPNDENWHKLDSIKETTVWSLAANSAVLLAGTRTEAGVFRSLNNGATWLSTPLQKIGVLTLCSNGNILFVGTNTGKIMRSEDNGVTWKEANTNGTRFFVTAFFVSGRIMLASGIHIGDTPSAKNDDNIIVRSEDNGATWTMVHNLRSPATSYISFGAIGQFIFAAVPGGSMLRSLDAGISWQQLTNEAPSWSFWNPRLVANGSVLINASDKIYRSLDNGVTWQEIPSALNRGSITCVLARGDATFFFGTTSDGVYRSDDNGLTWKPFNPGMVIQGVSVLTIKDNILFAAADGYGVYQVHLR